MPVFALQFQMTFIYNGTSGHGATFSGEVDIEASGLDTARRKLTSELALNALQLALEQDASFNRSYDNIDIKIRSVEEKTL